MEIRLNRYLIIRWLIVIAIALVVMHLLTKTFFQPGDSENLQKILRQFDLNEELNFPSLFSGALLLLCTIMLGLITIHKKEKEDRYYRHWVFLTLIFGYLVADELSTIHEGFSMLRSVFNLSGIFYYAWVIPFGVLVIIFALAYLGFTWALPSRYRNLFILAGIIYVSGALGFELVAGNYISSHSQDYTYSLLNAVEEGLEMAGAILFLYALMSYLEELGSSYQLRVTSQNKNAPPDEVRSRTSM